MDWLGAILEAYGDWEERSDNQREGRYNRQHDLAMLERAAEIRQRERDQQRDYVRQGFAAYAPYGAGGNLDPFAQYRPQQGQPASSGGLLSNAQLAPQNYYQGTRG